MLETIDVGIVSCDADGVFVVSNRAEREMFGLETGIDGLVAAQINSRIDVFEDGRKLDAAEYPLLRTLRGEPVTHLDVVAGPAGGPYRNIVVRGRQITGAAGEVVGAVAALTDVTADRVASRALVEEHRKLTEAQRLGQVGSFEYDFATDGWTFSDQMCRLWGLEPGGLTPQLIMKLIYPDDAASATNSWHAALESDGIHTCKYRIHRADDGAERLLRSNIEVERDSDGEPLQGRGTLLDVTELNAAEQSARRANAFFDAVLTAIPDSTFVTDVRNGAVIYGSRGHGVLGYENDELGSLGAAGTLALVHPDDTRRLAAFRSAALQLGDGQVQQTQYRALHADGRWCWLSHRVTPFRRDDDGRVLEVLAVVRDVSDVVEAEQRLVHAARHDYLTGLPNRALLVERLGAALTRSDREGREVAVLFCDLDGFKRVNDNGGHGAGDAVLIEVAKRMSAVLRGGDVVARVGGDEFVILVEPWNRASSAEAPTPQGNRRASDRVAQSSAVGVAERVIEGLRRPITAYGTDYLVTASIGITYARVDAHRDGAATADDVLHQADAAMYHAKAHGKNRLEIFDHISGELDAG
ncbi:MAG: diguanylate cyclase domain-containing protein [Acidothermaceae bacterium]